MAKKFSDNQKPKTSGKKVSGLYKAAIIANKSQLERIEEGIKALNIQQENEYRKYLSTLEQNSFFLVESNYH